MLLFRSPAAPLGHLRIKLYFRFPKPQPFQVPIHCIWLESYLIIHQYGSFKLCIVSNKKLSEYYCFLYKLKLDTLIMKQKNNDKYPQNACSFSLLKLVRWTSFNVLCLTKSHLIHTDTRWSTWHFASTCRIVAYNEKRCNIAATQQKSGRVHCSSVKHTTEMLGDGRQHITTLQQRGRHNTFGTLQ